MFAKLSLTAMAFLFAGSTLYYENALTKQKETMMKQIEKQQKRIDAIEAKLMEANRMTIDDVQDRLLKKGWSESTAKYAANVCVFNVASNF